MIKQAELTCPIINGQKHLMNLHKDVLEKRHFFRQWHFSSYFFALDLLEDLRWFYNKWSKMGPSRSRSPWWRRTTGSWTWVYQISTTSFRFSLKTCASSSNIACLPYMCRDITLENMPINRSMHEASKALSNQGHGHIPLCPLARWRSYMSSRPLLVI